MVLLCLTPSDPGLGFSSDDLDFEPGIYELFYTFPFLPLCPKSYNWQLSLWDEEGNVDLWEAFRI